MTTVEEYKAAMNELSAASAAFAPISNYVRQIGEAISGDKSFLFLQTTFAQANENGGHFHDARYKLDLSKWPSGETLRQAGARLTAAYNYAHRVYSELPSEDKEYLKSPPYQPELKLR